MTAHDSTFRDNQEAFEIVARVWHHHSIEKGHRPKLKLSAIGRNHFGLTEVVIRRISRRAEFHVQGRLRGLNGGGVIRNGVGPGKPRVIA